MVLRTHLRRSLGELWLLRGPLPRTAGLPAPNALPGLEEQIPAQALPLLDVKAAHLPREGKAPGTQALTLPLLHVREGGDRGPSEAPC